jgi:SMC interacting uncharacterized protein involved in chromosome segregation
LKFEEKCRRIQFDLNEMKRVCRVNKTKANYFKKIDDQINEKLRMEAEIKALKEENSTLRQRLVEKNIESFSFLFIYV